MALKTLRKDLPSAGLYDADFFRWTEEQGRVLRELRPSKIDWENVAEEIETLGRSDKRAIESNLNVILLHLLKWRSQVDQRKSGWRSSIAEHRVRVRKLIDESPSLRSHPAEVLEDEYRLARMKAADETGQSEGHFPRSCPFTIEQVLDPEFLPDAGKT
jgi:hypothetical protein